MESEKDTNELLYKRGIDFPTLRINLWLPGGTIGRRVRLGIWDWPVHTAVFKIGYLKGPTV